jgi:lipopolysaccharide/colanic/teichoic acid biosynthesis glycosyltransferase
VGDYSSLPGLIHDLKIEEVIITLPEEATEDFIQILSYCEPQQVKIKIPHRTHEIYFGSQESLVSHAYLQLFTEKMVLWQWMIKRIIDATAALTLLAILSPFFLVTAAYIGLKFHKSVFVKIPILGKNGIPFLMYVFRLTGMDYHFENNPIYLGASDPETSGRGFLRFLYRYRLYKLPQIINVFLGDMSLVGPRPEPVEWFDKFRNDIRFIHRRLAIRPGLTGLGQVKYHYEMSTRILKERVRFDIYYIENLSLRMDFRILLRTLFLLFKKPAELPLDDPEPVKNSRQHIR